MKTSPKIQSCVEPPCPKPVRQPKELCGDVRKKRFISSNLHYCTVLFGAVGGRMVQTDLRDVSRCRDREGLSIESEGDIRHVLDVLAVHYSL